MNEKLVIVPKEVTKVQKMWNILWGVIACFFLLLSILLSPVFFTFSLIFILIWYFKSFQNTIEYEYTYFDGDLRFARIKNKRKRKRIASISMDDVICMAPKGDRSIYKYENDSSIKCKKLLSGNANAKIYELICKVESDSVLMRYEFEPDEEMLQAMLMKYGRVIVK